MTVRDFIQNILLAAPDLDADVYVTKVINDVESKSYPIISIDNAGSNDGVFIEIKES